MREVYNQGLLWKAGIIAECNMRDWDFFKVILKMWLFSRNIHWSILFLEIMVTQGSLYRTDYLIAVKNLFNEWTHTHIQKNTHFKNIMALYFSIFFATFFVSEQNVCV